MRPPPATGASLPPSAPHDRSTPASPSDSICVTGWTRKTRALPAHRRRRYRLCQDCGRALQKSRCILQKFPAALPASTVLAARTDRLHCYQRHVTIAELRRLAHAPAIPAAANCGKKPNSPPIPAARRHRVAVGLKPFHRPAQRSIYRRRLISQPRFAFRRKRTYFSSHPDGFERRQAAYRQPGQPVVRAAA